MTASAVSTDFATYPDWVRAAYDDGVDSYREQFGKEMLPTIQPVVLAHYLAVTSDFIIEEGGAFSSDEEEGVRYGAAETVERLCMIYHIHYLTHGSDGLTKTARLATRIRSSR